jgi:hypothetical protein
MEARCEPNLVNRAEAGRMVRRMGHDDIQDARAASGYDSPGTGMSAPEVPGLP